jgi:hypothetical protein
LKKWIPMMAIIILLGASSFANTAIDTVSAATGSSSGGSSSGSSSTATVPKAPSGLALAPTYQLSETMVMLVWNDNSSNESKFRVERKTGGQTVWKEVAAVASNTTSYTDKTVAGGTSYQYRIRAYNSNGNSASSNLLSVTTKAAAVTPTPPVVTPTPPVVTPDPAQPGLPAVIQNTPSAWAKAEVAQAWDAGLIDENLMGKYNVSITRAEFSRILINLFAAAGGAYSETDGANPFSDTTDPAVIEAFNLGITTGIDNRTFGPDRAISRQEAAVMIQRTLQALSSEREFTVTETTRFSDASQAAGWATGAIAYLNEHGVMNGIDNNRFDPRGYLSREQAMLLAYRTYVVFGTVEQPVSDVSGGSGSGSSSGNDDDTETEDDD